jgi:pyruvate kinase
VSYLQIVCTIGPASWSKETLIEMIDAGMNVARLNFSHGDHERHAETVTAIREAAEERPGCNVAILLDTKGPEIRTGMSKDHANITLTAGQSLKISTDYTLEGDSSAIACSYASLPTSVKPGSTILAADGSLVMVVKECLADGVTVTVKNDAVLGERKNMNLPGVIVDLPTITPKDEDDLVNFGVPQGVDFIAASFVRKGSDIDTIRAAVGHAGAGIKIIAKIENQEGLDNFHDILAKADGIMVARGDLGMEIPTEKVFLAQKMMIAACNKAGKPAITATQMLESMIKNPRPTRAEAADVANAVLDGTDAVMLSGESASGKFPLEAVTVMSRICVEAERVLGYTRVDSATRWAGLSGGHSSVPESIASSAVKTALDIGAKAIIACSETGNTARLLAKYRAPQAILVLTADDMISRQVTGLTRGARAINVGSMLGTDALLLRAVEQLREDGLVDTGDRVIALHGMIEARPGSTNLLKVMIVS